MINTPYIEPEEEACILCDKCMAVCPTEALTVELRDEIDMRLAQIDRAACYPWVDRGICGTCVSICHLGKKVIGFEMWNQYRPAIQQSCVGCGLCVEVCHHRGVSPRTKMRGVPLRPPAASRMNSGDRRIGHELLFQVTRYF